MKRLFIALFCLTFLTCFVGCKNSTASIENKINAISKIESLEEKMMKIIEIEKIIQGISTNKKDNIENLYILQEESDKTLTELKQNMGIEKPLNNNYLTIDDLLEVNKIKKMDLIKNFSSMILPIEEADTINKIIKLIDVPYIETNEFIINNVNVYDLLNDYQERYTFEVKDTNGKRIKLNIYSNGYIILSFKEDNNLKEFVSILKIDFNYIKEIC